MTGELSPGCRAVELSRRCRGAVEALSRRCLSSLSSLSSLTPCAWASRSVEVSRQVCRTVDCVELYMYVELSSCTSCRAVIELSSCRAMSS